MKKLSSLTTLLLVYSLNIHGVNYNNVSIINPSPRTERSNSSSSLQGSVTSDSIRREDAPPQNNHTSYYPPFNPALGSPCWQGTTSWCSETKDLCCKCKGRHYPMHLVQAYRDLPEPVAQCRICFMYPQLCCCAATVITGVVLGCCARNSL